MGTFKLLEPKRSLTWFPPAPTVSLFQPSRSFAPLSAPAPEPVPLITQAWPDYTARSGHSFAQIPIFPSHSTPSLMQGEPTDKYEQEADHAAQQVSSGFHPSPSASTNYQHPVIQHTGSLHSEQERQAKSATQEGDPTSVDLGTSIQQARSSGQPLSADIRTPMERAFRTVFSHVRVHTDAQAHQLNRSLYAQAFTTGQDIFFQRGVYRPKTRSGQELLAHELTHVVQQQPLSKLSGFLQRKKLVNAKHMDPNGDWKPTADGQGRVTKIEATNLKLMHGYNALPGSGHNPPTDAAKPKGWKHLAKLNLIHPQGPPNYVKMHMLNGRLGGPGNDVQNLAPGSASLNSHHSANFENEALTWLNQGGEIEEYTVKVTYNAPSHYLKTQTAKTGWESTVKEIEGEFKFIHYDKVTNKRKIDTAPFKAEEDANLDNKLNWHGW